MADSSRGVQLIIAILAVYVLYQVISTRRGWGPLSLPFGGSSNSAPQETADDAGSSATASAVGRAPTWVKNVDAINMRVRARGDVSRNDFKDLTVVAMVHRGCGHCSNPAFKETLEKVSQRYRVLVVTDEGALKPIPGVDDKIPFIMSRTSHYPRLLAVDVNEGRISHPKNEPKRRTEHDILEWAKEEHVSLDDMHWERGPVVPASGHDSEEEKPLTSEEHNPETLSSQNERGREHLPKSNTDYSSLITGHEEQEAPFKSDARESMAEGIPEEMRAKWLQAAEDALEASSESGVTIENLWE